MPESAEVKLTTDFLARNMTNKIINNWFFTSGQYKDNMPEGFEEFYNSLPLLVEEVSCKGKFIYITCFNEKKKFYILHSLRMTGSWRISNGSYSRWYLDIENIRLWFHDPRCLATLKFTTNQQELQSYLSKLGPDILSDEFTIEKWTFLVNKHKQKNITSFLMNQEIISGCGNYIKAEALYEAKISPLRKIGSLTSKESENLYIALCNIPRYAYLNKGVSKRDYTDENGDKGKYQFFLKIYGKKTAKRTKTSDGRTTYWDDKVQN